MKQSSSDKQIKLILLATEIVSVCGAIFLIWCGDLSSAVNKTFITLFVLLGVTMQKEYSYWHWTQD